jgi:hypothetical protein
MRRDSDRDRIAALQTLIGDVGEAATEAARMGYPHVARLLDSCGSDLMNVAPGDHPAIANRARKALAVWSALRSLPLPESSIR